MTDPSEDQSGSAAATATLAAAFPLTHRTVIAALRAGELPSANGMLWV
jgi:hypothetical protein